MDLLDSLAAVRSGVAEPVAAMLVAIAAWVQEDLGLAGAGVLSSQGEISLRAALAGAYLGVVSADIACFVLGRCAGGRLLSSERLRRLVGGQIDRGREWVRRHGTAAVFASRFMPGLRTAAHAAAGALGMRWRPFLLATLVSALLWVPAVVLTAFAFGPRVRGWFEQAGAHPVLSIAASLLLLAVAVRGGASLSRSLFGPVGRSRQ